MFAGLLQDFFHCDVRHMLLGIGLSVGDEAEFAVECGRAYLRGNSDFFAARQSYFQFGGGDERGAESAFAVAFANGNPSHGKDLSLAVGEGIVAAGADGRVSVVGDYVRGQGFLVVEFMHEALLGHENLRPDSTGVVGEKTFGKYEFHLGD